MFWYIRKKGKNIVYWPLFLLWLNLLYTDSWTKQQHALSWLKSCCQQITGLMLQELQIYNILNYLLSKMLRGKVSICCFSEGTLKIWEYELGERETFSSVDKYSCSRQHLTASLFCKRHIEKWKCMQSVFSSLASNYGISKEISQLHNTRLIHYICFLSCLLG